jgi:hypothetical protein
MKKKALLFTGLFLFILTSITAIDIIDPSDIIYEDLEFWDEQGYFKQLPAIRPYPSQLILSLLETVIEKGTADDARLAQSYYDEINQGFRAETSAGVSSYYGRSGLGDTTGTLELDLRGMLSDKLSIWGELSANGTVNDDDVDYYMYDDDVAYGDRVVSTTMDDAGTFMGIALAMGTSSMLSYGTDELYVNLGLYRSSFGPFSGDSIVISDEAYQQGHFELTWLKDNFTYSMLMLSLIGTSNTGSTYYNDDDDDDDDNDTIYDKYLVMHSYGWSPKNWLELGFFETVVYGERFEATYLLPFSTLYYLQGYSGFSDNSLMGLDFSIDLPHQLEYNGILYVDDLNFNEIVSLNLNTYMKMAFQTGASWSPNKSWLRRLSLDYTAVFPYMYTHYDWHSEYDADDFNTDNYTQNGQNLGTTLSPNSDRINLTWDYRMNDTTQFSFFSNWMRHGNASDGEDDSANGDGSLWDCGIYDDGEYYFDDFLPFLTQDVLEKVLQFGVDFSTTVDMPFQDTKHYYGMELSIGYTFEMIWNSGRDSGDDASFEPKEGEDEVNQYISLSMNFFF